jgi:probable F420-dependent oxidoreductase
VRIGICLPQMGLYTSPDVVDEFLGRAEEVGFDSLWTQEHLFRPLRPISPYGGMPGATWPVQHQQLLATFELLAYAAARTRCEVGTSVAIAGYHHPVDLAKRAATIDVLSRGRMRLGIGVGWCRDEFELLGASFQDRGSLADEMLEALLACWGPNPVEYRGQRYRVPLSETSPKPFRGDRVPLVGGFMSARGCRRVAEFCNVWQPFRLEPDEAMRAMDELNAVAARDFDRGPLELSLRVLVSPEIPGLAGGHSDAPGRWAGGISALTPRVEAAVDAGCDELVIDTSFAAGIASSEAWIAQPSFFEPLVALAHT